MIKVYQRVSYNFNDDPIEEKYLLLTMHDKYLYDDYRFDNDKLDEFIIWGDLYSTSSYKYLTDNHIKNS